MEEIFLILFGFIIGSFLNVLIHRLPRGESVVKPGSHCPRCQEHICFYDNIPLISYVLLRGKCRKCKNRISWQYPFVEALTAFTFWLAFKNFKNDPFYFLFAILFLGYLITLAFIDFKHMILPDELTISGAIIFLVYSFFNPKITFIDAFAAAFGSALVFLGMYFLYLKVRKIEGLGMGDVKMLLLLGAFLGSQKLILAILLASLSGILVGGAIMIVKKKDMKFALPFGTFLSFGSYISVFWGNKILAMIKFMYY